VNAGERLSLGGIGKAAMIVMVANRTRESRPSGMTRGACGNVGTMGVGLRPIGKSMESPPDPTTLRAPHFYPNSGARMRGVISEGGGNASLAGERRKVLEKSKRARRRKPDTAKADLEPPSCNSLEGRVSIARWNPKGMRRSTGL
jgi:hypothetical protein